MAASSSAFSEFVSLSRDLEAVIEVGGAAADDWSPFVRVPPFSG